MKFRPCIDIHNGKVKQIVGGSLQDKNDEAKENFVSMHDAAYYASLYKANDLRGGHIVLLNSSDSVYFEETKKQAIEALRAYPGGMQIGGSMNAENGKQYLELGASHIIVTSYLFEEGRLSRNRLKDLKQSLGAENIVIDLSCRKRGNHYYVVTNRWQTYTDTVVDLPLLEELSEFCDEFLIHGVDVEGMAQGMEEDLLQMLGEWDGKKVTYAGGIRSLSDMKRLECLGKGRVDATIGSALDLFGGSLSFEEVIKF